MARRPPSTPVVCMQNGVENERRALRHFSRTYGMCVMCPASQVHPGVVQVHSAPVSGLMDLGCYPEGIDEQGRAIAHAIASTTFESVPRADIMRWKYRKLLMNLANAIEALSGPGRAVQPAGQGGRSARGTRRWPRRVSRRSAGRRTGSAGATPCSWRRRRRGSGRAGRAGRAWPAGPARSRPSTSTARSSCWAASTAWRRR